MPDSNCRIPIQAVVPGSIAQDLGILPGDFLLTVNGSCPQDIIDYRYMEADEELILTIESQGEIVEMEIEKDIQDDLGIIFDLESFSPIRQCENKCIFCFVDQLPPGLRSTLYIKDDDYRYSVLAGNFITLTNLGEEDRQRIIEQKLSPLHISLHAFSPEVRSVMMGNKRAGKVREDIKAFCEAGLTMHIQIVLCPGWNDGRILDDTLEELGRFYPGIRSIGVVPVGLTGHRSGLVSLVAVDSAKAEETIQQINKWRKWFHKQLGYPLVFAADEFYSQSALPLPDRGYYEEFPQTENGIGLIRKLLDHWEEEKKHLPASCDSTVLTVITGVSSARYVEKIVCDMNTIPGLKVQLKTVSNRFFGGHITVTGLLTGHDLTQALEGIEPGSWVMIPSSMLLDEKDRFLDDMTIVNLEEALEISLMIVDALGCDLANKIKHLCTCGRMKKA